VDKIEMGPSIEKACQIGILANSSKLTKENQNKEKIGQPTELALLLAIEKINSANKSS